VSDVKTLEKLLREVDTERHENGYDRITHEESAAIRALLEKCKELEATIDRADEHTKKLMEEIERLRADIEFKCELLGRYETEADEKNARIGAAVAAINAGRDKSIAAILRGEKL